MDGVGNHRISALMKPTSSSAHSSHLSAGGGDFPPPKGHNSPLIPNVCQIVCSKSFFSAAMLSCQFIMETFLLTENRHRKLFVIKQSKNCKFVTKMHQNTFGGRAPPGELVRSPRLPSRHGVCLLLRGGRRKWTAGNEKKEGSGVFVRGTAEGREGEELPWRCRCSAVHQHDLVRVDWLQTSQQTVLTLFW